MLTTDGNAPGDLSEVTGVRTSSGGLFAYDSRSGEAKRLDL